MDRELLSVIKRYLFVGLVLSASVVWTVWYSTDATRQTIGAPTLELPETQAPQFTAEAKTHSGWLVERRGLSRVLCEPACNLEDRCGLRERALCEAQSCDGDIRKLNLADFALEKAAAAQDCGAVAMSACEEACARQGECKKDHTGDNACRQACEKLMKTATAKTWKQARCIIETRHCADVDRCRS